MLTRFDVEIFADYCREDLELENFVEAAEYNYPCLPYCLLDAIFSISANYSSTRKVVERYAAYYNIDSLDHEHTVSEFLENIRECGGAEKFAENVVKNRQRTSTKSGILKAEAVRLVAEVCKTRGIETLEDFREYSDRESLDSDILAVRGQSSGVMLHYLKMLAGDTTEAKPDRFIERYIRSVLPHITDHEDMVELIREATKELRDEFPTLTPRKLDGCIWSYARRSENRIRVFVGDGAMRLKEVVCYHSDVTEFEPNHDYNRDLNFMNGAAFESHKGQSKKIIDNLESFVNWLEKSGRYSKEPIFFTDFLGLIDEATDVKPYFKRILDLDAEIFYFAECDSSLERLESCGLLLEAYIKK